MCCGWWPWSDVYLEEDPRNKKHAAQTANGFLYHDPVSKTTVRLKGVSYAQVQALPQAYTPYPHPGAAGYAVNPAAPVYLQPSVPYYNPFTMQQPVGQSAPNFAQSAFGYIGATPAEVTAAGIAQAQVGEMNGKQEMKPADDDPFRFYWVRELDQSWSQRNRMTIDSGDIGECRWYAKDGTFYAVRLPMS